MTDHLIEQLVADLQPTKPLRNAQLWMHSAMCLFFIAILLLGSIGLRGDYARAMQTGALFWKPALFFFLWLGSIWIITDISRPDGKIQMRHILPLMLGFSLLFWQFALQLSQYSLQTMIQSLQDTSALVCVFVVLGGGAITMGIAWKFWFSHTASPYPVQLGFLAGVSAGTLAATAYALHCDRDIILYVSLYNGLSILGLGMIGSFLGNKWLRW